MLVWQNITFNCRRVAGTLINLSSHHVCPREKGRGLTSHKTIGRRKCHTYSAIPARALTRTNTMWINTLVSYLYLASLSIWHNWKNIALKRLWYRVLKRQKMILLVLKSRQQFFHQRLKLYSEIHLFIFCVEKYLFAIKCHICLAFERVEWFTEAFWGLHWSFMRS